MSIGEPYLDGEVWMIPTRAESPDGKAIGFGWQPLLPDDPMYDEWMSYIRSRWAERLSR